jgi:hypothetical protein
MSEKREIATELEGLLQDHRFHLNGFDQTRTSMLGTYRGVLDYQVVEKVVQDNPDLDWAAGVEVWKYDFESTGSPTFNLLALEVERQIAKIQTSGKISG